MPNMSETPWATIVSVNASLAVMVVGVVRHAGSSRRGVEVEKVEGAALARCWEREKRGLVLATRDAMLLGVFSGERAFITWLGPVLAGPNPRTR